MSTSPALYELRAGPFVQGELRVLRFKGRETLSKPFAFEILFDSETPPWELEAGLVGQSATLVMQSPSHPPRVVRGVAAWLRARTGGRTTRPARCKYTLRLVPSVWKLSKRVNTRIFQDQAASDVITTLTKRVPGWRCGFGPLPTPLPERNYCVQYQESDLGVHHAPPRGGGLLLLLRAALPAILEQARPRRASDAAAVAAWPAPPAGWSGGARRARWRARRSSRERPWW